jgi:type III pantothenate kinase
MLVAIDIGNSTIAWGLFEQRTLVNHWKTSTAGRTTEADLGFYFLSVLEETGIAVTDVTDAIISSVVPRMTVPVWKAVQTRLYRNALIVSAELDCGLTLRTDNPREIGSDRLANAAASFERYRKAAIVVDCGTATTFSVVTGAGEFIGGAIAPGLGMAAEELASGTAQLPRVDLALPRSAIGRTTVSAIQSGILYGFAGLVDGLVDRLQKEVGEPAVVVATGGCIALLAPLAHTIQEVRPHLTLEGLELIARRARHRPS